MFEEEFESLILFWKLFWDFIFVLFVVMVLFRVEGYGSILGVWVGESIAFCFSGYLEGRR